MEKRRSKRKDRELRRRDEPKQLQLRPPDSVFQQANIRLYEATERRVQREGEALMTQLRIEMEQRNIIYQLASFCAIDTYANLSPVTGLNIYVQKHARHNTIGYLI